MSGKLFQQKSAVLQPANVSTPSRAWQTRGEAIRRSRDPFRCVNCGDSRSLQPYSTIHANGSSTSHYRKGLFLKTGWSESRRQTDLAKQCAPPRRRNMVWRIALLLVGAALIYPWDILAGSSYDYDLFTAGAVVVVVGICTVAAAVLWNMKRYPVLLNRYNHTYLCRRCGVVSYIQVV